VTKRFLIIGFVLSLVVWLIFILQLAPATNVAFQSAWNHYMGEGAYLNHLVEARSAGMQAHSGLLPVLTAGLVLGFSLFTGYFNGTFFAREVKKPEKNLLRGSWAALALTWARMALAAVMWQRIIPIEWLAAESYLARLSQYRDVAVPWLPFYAALINPNPRLVSFVATARMLTLLALAYTFLYAGSRVVTAWSDDGVVPDQVRFVHPVLRSPLIAVLLVCIAAEVGLVASALGGRIEGLINPVLFIAGVQIMPVLAVILFPFLKPDWFARSPQIVRRMVGRVPLISIIGSLSLIFLVWTISASLLFPTNMTANLPMLLLFLGVFVAGLIWFFVRQYYRRSGDEQAASVFQNLPED